MPEPDTASNETSLARTADGLDSADREILIDAVRRLQASRGVLVRSADLLSGLFGTAAGLGLRRLNVPHRLGEKFKGLATAALRRAFDLSVVSMDTGNWVTTAGGSRLAAVASGATTGLTGLSGFLPDATFNTLLIMRNIAAIAREQGEDLDDPDARQACLEVFAFGGPSLDGTAEEPDLGYWSARLVLHGRPLMVVFSEVAARYGLRLSEKLAVQAVPLFGAAGAAMVNAVFLNHYRSLAQVHFTIRRLERQYGGVAVRETAVQIASNLRLARAA